VYFVFHLKAATRAFEEVGTSAMSDYQHNLKIRLY
jgi:hypothetical protein